MKKGEVSTTTTYLSDTGLKKAVVTEILDSGDREEGRMLSIRFMISNHVECVVSAPAILDAIRFARAWCDKGELPEDG